MDVIPLARYRKPTRTRSPGWYPDAPVGEVPPLAIVFGSDGRDGELIADTLVAEGFIVESGVREARKLDDLLAYRCRRADLLFVDLVLGPDLDAFDLTAWLATVSCTACLTITTDTQRDLGRFAAELARLKGLTVLDVVERPLSARTVVRSATRARAIHEVRSA